MTDWIIAICAIAVLPLYMCSGIILNRIERKKLEKWREYK